MPTISGESGTDGTFPLSGPRYLRLRYSKGEPSQTNYQKSSRLSPASRRRDRFKREVAAFRRTCKVERLKLLTYSPPFFSFMQCSPSTLFSTVCSLSF